MKTVLLGLVALGAQVALAIPHGGHVKAHGKRGPFRQFNRLNPSEEYPPATTTFTTITTVTDPAAVVWVDQNNNVIYTEFRPKPTAPPAAPAPPENTSVAPPSADPAPADPYAAPTADKVQDRVAPQPETNQGASSESSGGGGYGVCYDLMADNGGCRTSDQMNKELGFIKGQGYGLARTYDIGCDVGAFIQAAANNGLRVMVGINLINNVAGDINTLINKVGNNWGPVHTVNVGNEVVNNGGSPAAVAAAVNAARPLLQGAGFTGSVVAVDTFNQHVAHPAICAASDYCAANAHAFFDPQTSPPNAGTFVKNAYDQISRIANGKRVVITESGWAKQGAAEGASVPGVSQQQQAISSIKQAFPGMPDSLYIFQAYDAKYKQPGARGVETSFGIF